MGGQSSPELQGYFGYLWIKKIYDIAIFFQEEKKIRGKGLNGANKKMDFSESKHMSHLRKKSDIPKSGQSSPGLRYGVFIVAQLLLKPPGFGLNRLACKF